MTLPACISDVVDEATGAGHRDDPVAPHTGGPAGNARITAWTGLALLVLIAIEMVTALDVRGMLSWHIAVGTLLVPFALLKTATTAWRTGRYYTGNGRYRRAGPPPTLLRFLGPLVVLSTLGVLGSGLALIALGQDASRTVWFSALGQDVDAVALHQALFVGFAIVTGLHLLARIVPAITLVTGRGPRTIPGRPAVPGGAGRLVALLATVAAAAITAALVLGASDDWQRDRGQRFDGAAQSLIGAGPQK